MSDEREQRVETITVGGLRYIVARLAPADIELIARRVAVLLRDADQTRVDADLASEHARQVPYEAIVAESRLVEARRREAEAQMPLLPDEFPP